MLSGSLDKLSFTTTLPTATVVISIGSEIILEETYVPDARNLISLRDLDRLIVPYLASNLIETFHYVIKDIQNTIEKDFTVQFSATEISMEAGTFLDEYFLSLLLGTKTTALGRSEFVHLVCREACLVKVKLEYMVGDRIEVKERVLQDITEVNKVITVDVSPDLFVVIGKMLFAYTVTAGLRTMRFEIDTLTPDTAPDLVFTNSFGCQETIYCGGTHQVDPKYNRETAVIDGKLRSYQITENRNFKANTGILSPDMANWTEDLFRSKEVYLLDGGATGKEVTITESKSLRNNNPDNLPSFEFEYRYAQRNHNIMPVATAGRVFDNTFDRTFN